MVLLLGDGGESAVRGRGGHRWGGSAVLCCPAVRSVGGEDGDDLAA